MSEPASDEGIYDLADTGEAPRPQTVVSPPALAEPGQPILLQYRAAGADKAGPIETETIKNVHLPLWLLGGGIVLKILASILWMHQIGGALLELAVDLTLGTGIMLVAMLVAAKLYQIDLGKIPVAIYKLAAISIAPSALIEFLAPVARFLPLGLLLLWVVQFMLFFALLGALFDLQEGETWYCVMVLCLIRIGIFCGLTFLFHQ
jgi:hypothetical protein